MFSNHWGRYLEKGGGGEIKIKHIAQGHTIAKDVQTTLKTDSLFDSLAEIKAQTVIHL